MRLDRIDHVRVAVVVAAVVAMIAIGIGPTGPIAVVEAQEEDAVNGNQYGDVDCSLAGIRFDNVTCGSGDLTLDRKNLSWTVDNLTESDAAGLAMTTDTIEGIEWGRNGTRLYVLDVDYGASTTTLRTLSLSDNYNISTVSTLRTAALSGFYSGMDTSPDGQYLYLVNLTGTNSVERYEMSDRWNTTSRSSSGTIDVDFLSENPWDIEWSAAGEKFDLLTVSEIHRFVPISTSWSVIASWKESVSHPAGVSSNGPRAIRWKDDNANLDFSGIGSNEYVSVPDDPSLNVSGDFSLAFEAYVPTLDVDGGNNYRIVSMKGELFDDEGYNVVIEEDGRIRARFGLGTQTYGPSSDSSIPTNNTRATVVVTREASSGDISFYIDGELDYTETGPSGDLTDSPGDFRISRSSGDQEYLGELDRLILDDDVWTDGEIRDYHNRSHSGSSPAARYEMDEGKGTTLADSSTNGNDGTLINGADWGSGNFSVAGGRLLVLDNDVAVVAGDDRLRLLEGSGDYDLASLSQIDVVDASHDQDTDDRRGMAVRPGGTHITLIGCCATGAFEYDAGFHSEAEAIFRYSPTDTVLYAKLNWTDDESGGRVDYGLNVTNQNDFVDVSDREDEWILFDRNDDAVYVQVSPVWDGSGTSSPTADSFQLAIDNNDATGLNLTVPEEMGLNESASFSACVSYQNDTCQDRTGSAQTTVNRSDVLEVFTGNGTLVSNTNSSLVAVNSSIDEDGSTWTANETTAVFGTRLEDYRFLDPILTPILIFTDWGWAALFVIASLSALVARELGAEAGMGTFAVLSVFGWLLEFVALEVVILVVLLTGLLIIR